MMQPIKPSQKEQERLNRNLRRTLQMQQEGILAMKQKLIDEHPNETPQQISQRLAKWLSETPDADDPRFFIRRDYSKENRSHSD